MSTWHDHLGGMSVICILLGGSAFGRLADVPNLDDRDQPDFTVDRYISYLIGDDGIKFSFAYPPDPAPSSKGLALLMQRDGFRMGTLTGFPDSLP